MSLLDHVAMAVDFSEPSRIALAAVYRLAAITPVRRLSIIHSVQEVVLPVGDQPALRKRLEDLRERIHTAANTQLAEMCASFPKPDGVEITHHVVEGTPARSVPKAATEMGATLMALGTHHRKGIRRWLKGSVAEQIVRGTEIPVLILPLGEDGVTPEDEIKKLEHIVVGLDLHAEAEHVAALAIEAARSVRPPPPMVTMVTAAHVQDFPFEAGDEEAKKAVDDVQSAIQDGAQAQLDAIAATFAETGVAIEARIVDRLPVDAILETAESVDAGMIVVGTHGRNLAPLIEIGSTTAKILRGANVSVLVVPSHPEHHK